MEGTWLFLTLTELKNPLLYLKKLSTKCKWSVWDIQVQPQSMKTQIKPQRSTAGAWWTGITISSWKQEEEEEMTGGIPVLRSMVLVRKAASQTEQRASITLSPIPESLVSSSKNQLGISKSHTWAEFSSQGQQRGDVLSNFLTAFISFNSSCPTHMCSIGYSKLH